ncbi:hypothetical protein BJ965_002723 [Streptomyces luteogriseus]|uniref:Uncharacterized protein n=1 Tax=Streptomyces luteogriseus TaxID=68233 RepID=A0A7W7DLH5_9ACTN|nr:hypothetical protein [Streptomyces luteogriseus]MBB4712841.1 hypothetical protein [Streptomyces luteogriseus]
MGDRLSRGGATGRRRVHPGDAADGPWGPRDDTALRAVLTAALTADDPGPEAERRAVAAFRTARDAGAHGARTRHRDDWRLPAPGRTGRPVKTTAAAVFTSIALGGVAVAAIGSVGSPANGTGGTAPSSAPAPARSGGQATQVPSDGPGRGGPSSAPDTAAQCRAYERVEGRGTALGATAWQRLVAAAGGEDEVDAYCAERLARSTAAPGGSGDPGKPGDVVVNPGAGAGAAGNRGTTGKGSVGNGRPGGGKGE